MRWQDDEISRLELIKKLFGDFIETVVATASA